MIQAKLLVIGGEVEVEEISLQLPVTIGRSREAVINLSHPLVSRHHCELFEANGVLMVRDLDSMNGTFVGSQRVSEAVVRPGDLLTVGTVTFRALYDHDPADATEEPAPKEESRARRRRRSAATSGESVAVSDDGELEETHRLNERETLEVRSRPQPDDGADELPDKVSGFRSSDR